MAWAASDITTLEATIRTVATTGKSVTFTAAGQTRTVTHQDLAELRSLLVLVKREVGAATTAPKLHRFGTFKRS